MSHVTRGTIPVTEMIEIPAPGTSRPNVHIWLSPKYVDIVETGEKTRTLLDSNLQPIPDSSDYFFGVRVYIGLGSNSDDITNPNINTSNNTERFSLSSVGQGYYTITETPGEYADMSKLLEHPVEFPRLTSVVYPQGSFNGDSRYGTDFTNIIPRPDVTNISFDSSNENIVYTIAIKTDDTRNLAMPPLYIPYILPQRGDVSVNRFLYLMFGIYDKDGKLIHD